MGLLNALPTALGEHVAVYIVYNIYVFFSDPLPPSRNLGWVGSELYIVYV